MRARAFWTVAPGRGEIREEDVPEGDAETILLRTLASGISRGTEALVFNGRVPANQYEPMRAPLMSGAFPFPVKYGYSAVAEAADGARYFVLHPHQDVIRPPCAMCIPVPDGVPTRRATLAANMETAVNILWDAAPLAGERVTVIGAGVVGLLTASLLVRIPGTAVTVIDIDPSRFAPAIKLGATPALPDAAPGDQDLVIHASASESGLRLALASCGFEGRIVEASWFGDQSPSLPLGEAFHSKRLRLISSQVGAVAGSMRARRSHAQRLALALDLLEDPVYEVLIDGATPFDTLPEAMPRLLAGGLCHVIYYGTDPCSV